MPNASSAQGSSGKNIQLLLIVNNKRELNQFISHFCFGLQVFFKEQNKLYQISHSSLGFSQFLPRGALPPHRDPEEHLAVAPCLREEGSVAGLLLPAHLSSRLQSPGNQEGGVPGLWELDSQCL